MKKTLTGLAMGASLVAALAFATTVFAAAPNWNISGTHNISFDYLGTPYVHEVTLAQDGAGNLTGSGGYPAGGPLVYTWVLTSGSVSGDTLDFTANYTTTPDAVTPQTTMHVVGTIASDGSVSGTWSDNYQGGARAGTFTMATGSATAIDQSPEVHIFKYVDGVQATALNANSAVFPMLTTFNSSVYGLVTDAPFTLSPTGWGPTDAPYEASYVGGAAGDDYTAHEVTGGNVVGASCAEGKPFALAGYSSGDTLSAAFTNASSTVAPAFADLQSDKYMIVWNTTCTVTPPSQVPTDKNQCMNNGWKTLKDTLGHSFKNQGDCVSFVASKGKNVAAGN